MQERKGLWVEEKEWDFGVQAGVLASSRTVQSGHQVGCVIGQLGQEPHHHCSKDVTLYGRRKKSSQRLWSCEQGGHLPPSPPKILSNDKQFRYTHLIPQRWKWKIWSLFWDIVIREYAGIYFPEPPDHLSNLCFFCFALTKSGYCPSFTQKQMKQNDSAPFVAWEAKTDTNTHENHMKGPSG